MKIVAARARVVPMGCYNRFKFTRKIAWGVSVNYLENMDQFKIAYSIFDKKPRERLDVTRANMFPRPISIDESYHPSL